MESTPVLKTARLLLTPLQLSDAPAIQELFPHWEVVRYLDSRAPSPCLDDDALTYMRDISLPAIAAGCEWHWMIYLALEPAKKVGSFSPMSLETAALAGPRIYTESVRGD